MFFQTPNLPTKFLNLKAPTLFRFVCEGYVRSIFGYDSFLKTHSELITWDQLPTVQKQKNVLIIKRFLNYLLSIGLKFKEKDQFDEIEKRDTSIWICRDPKLGFGDDKNGTLFMLFNVP